MDALAYPHDSFVKAIWSRPELAANFLENYLPPEIVAQLDVTTPDLLPESFIDQDLKVHRTDLLYRVRRKDEKPAFVYVLLEHKSAPAPRVGLQLLRYLTRIWVWHADQKRTGQLPLIFPLVLYHGRQRWRTKSQFAALIENGDAPDWSRYVPHLEYFLCDLSASAGETVKGMAALRLAIMALKYATDPKLHERLPDILRLVRELHEKSVLEFLGLVLRYFSQVSEVNNYELKAAAIAATAPDIGEQVMETLAVQWMREGRQQGLQEGRREGLQQGTQSATIRTALLILGRRCGPLPQKVVTRINALSVPQLEALIEASLDFTKRKDLDNWLKTNAAASRENLSNSN